MRQLSSSVYFYSWWKPQCWLKAPGLSVFTLNFLCSVAIYRHDSGRCHTLLPFLTYIFLSFHLFRFSFYIEKFTEMILIWEITKIILRKVSCQTNGRGLLSDLHKKKIKWNQFYDAAHWSIPEFLQCQFIPYLRLILQSPMASQTGDTVLTYILKKFIDLSRV